MIDLAIVDMPEDPIAPIILGRFFLRTIKATRSLMARVVVPVYFSKRMVVISTSI